LRLFRVMKLCIVSRKIVKGDGQGRVNYEIVKEALRRGHQVTLLASEVASEWQKSNSDCVNWVEIARKPPPTQLLADLVFSWQSASWLHQHLRDFDLVKVNGANTNEPADVNAVHFVHSSWQRSPVHPWRLHRDLNGAYQWLYTALNTNWEKKAFQQARIVVAVSEKVKQELLDIGVPSDRIRTISNGVDLQEFSPGDADRRQLGLPEGVTLALFAGDIRTPRKNLDTVLHALVRVPELHLAAIGATVRSPYPQLATSLGLGDRVHFLGYRHDVPEIMKAVDLFVFPSRYEPFGMVVSEAMASGLPVITTASTGAAEIVTPDCGIVLEDSEDFIALAEALQKLADCGKLRRQMGQVGRLIVQQYSWSSQAQCYVDLFETLITPDLGE
jgi:glycosyltransferase involved in cell wall biosynthesis